MSNTSKNKNRSLIILCTSVCLLLVHHLYLYGGHYGFDDMEYARLSNDLFNGHFDWSNHYSYRIVVLGLTGLIYQLLGVNDIASMIPAMLMSIGILAISYKIFKSQPLYYLAALLVYFSFHWNIYYSDKLMPDVYVSFFAFTAWYLYYKIERSSTNIKRNSILIALFLFLAFNSKGTIILMAPLFGYYFLKDLWCKKYEPWKYMIASITTLMGLYFTTTYFLMGNAMMRFDAIKANSYLNDCSYDQLGFAHLWERWTSGYVHFLMDEMLIIPFIFSVIGMGFYIRYRDYSKLGFYAVTSMILLLSVNFMTISISSYSPVCLDPRHILMVSPVTAICSIKILQYIIEKFNIKWAIYPVILMLLGSLYFYYIPAKSRMTLHYDLIRSDIQFLTNDSKLKGHFYGTPIWNNLSDYYGGFETRGEFIAQELDDLPETNNINGEIYLIRNYYTEFFAKLTEADIIGIVNKKGYELGKKPILVSPSKKIRVYRMVTSK